MLHPVLHPTDLLGGHRRYRGEDSEQHSVSHHSTWSHASLLLSPPIRSLGVSNEEAERCASGARSSRSDRGAEAASRRLQAVVRLRLGRCTACPFLATRDTLLDHAVRLQEQQWGHHEAQGLCRLEIEDQLELDRPLYR